MKVTKGQPKQGTKKVIAFYANNELVLRDRDSDNNYALCEGNSIYRGNYGFDKYLSMSQTTPGFIAFYEGDTIIIEL